MIIFPPEYITTDKIPAGYLWNMKEQKLYSFKVGGVLKLVTLQKSGYKRWFDKVMHNNYYVISDKGHKRMIFESYLKEIKDDYVIREVKKIS
jgi:hypothetical protein